MKKVVLGLVLSATLAGSNVSANNFQDTLKNAFGRTTTHVKDNKWTYGLSTAAVAVISGAVAYDLKHDAKILKVASAAKILSAKKYAQIKKYMEANPKKAIAILTPVIVSAVLGGLITVDKFYNKDESYTNSFCKNVSKKVTGLFPRKAPTPAPVA